MIYHRSIKPFTDILKEARKSSTKFSKWCDLIELIVVLGATGKGEQVQKTAPHQTPCAAGGNKYLRILLQNFNTLQWQKHFKELLCYERE